MNGATKFALALLPVAACLIALACGSSNTTPSTSPAVSSGSSSDTQCGGTTDHITFLEQLTLPTELPKGLTLITACSSGDQPTSQEAQFFYQTDGGSLTLLIRDAAGSVAAEPQDRTTIQLGQLVGYVSSESDQDATFYLIEFEKSEWSYSVAANLGSTNVVTTDDMTAVALSIAES